MSRLFLTTRFIGRRPDCQMIFLSKLPLENRSLDFVRFPADLAWAGVLDASSISRRWPVRRSGPSAPYLSEAEFVEFLAFVSDPNMVIALNKAIGLR